MKKQHNPLTRFIGGLIVLWLQQAALLVERIKQLPKNRDAIKSLAILCIGLTIVFGVGTWARNTGRCPRCARYLGFENRDIHLSSCRNCDFGIYTCPTLPHPHKSQCNICGASYYNCPEGPSQESEHGPAICKPLHERLSLPARHRFKSVPGALPLRNNKKAGR